MSSAVTRVGSRFQVTIPRDLRQAIGLKAGDLIQASVGANQTIVLRRKVRADRDPQLAKQLEAAEADVKAGRVLGPFDNAGAALRALRTFKRRRNARGHR